MMADLRLANLIIAGVARGGTTSLYSYLAAHPDVCGSKHKETEFFYPLFQNQPLPPLELYAEEFSDCYSRKYRMEATPGYMFGGKAMARTIDKVLPGTRVIIMLREPTSRALSFFTYFKSRFALPKDMQFEEYVQECKRRCSIEKAAHAIAPEYGALHSGAYSEFIEPWFEVFGERLLVLFSDELVDKKRLMNRLCTWLALDPNAIDWNSLRVFNPSTMYRGAFLHRSALKLNAAAEPFFRRHPRLKEHLTRIYLRVNSARDEDSRPNTDVTEAKSFFAPYNAKLLSTLRARGMTELPSWLTESESYTTGCMLTQTGPEGVAGPTD
jgi:hypothetical protein